MNIIILTDYYPPDKLGGVGEIARNLKIAYENLGHKAIVITTGKRQQSEIEEGVIRTADRLVVGVFLGNLAVLSQMKRQSVDLIHIHQSATTLFLFSRWFKRSLPKVISSFQVSFFSEARHIRRVRIGGKLFKPRLREYIEKFFYAPVHIVLDGVGYAFSDTITAVSEDNLRELTGTYGRLFPKPTEIVPNGVDTKRYDASSQTAPHKLAVDCAGHVIFSYVGVYRNRKRVFNLLHAFSNIWRIKPCKLLLIGGGRGYEQAVRDYIRELEIAEHVIEVGEVPNEEVPGLLALTDIFCLCSAYEGMPVALLEAMCMGKVVLTTEAFGMRELVEHGKSGWLVQVDDLEELQDAMSLLLENDRLRKDLGQAAQFRAREHFGWDRIARRYLALVHDEPASS